MFRSWGREMGNGGDGRPNDGVPESRFGRARRWQAYLCFVCAVWGLASNQDLSGAVNAETARNPAGPRPRNKCNQQTMPNCINTKRSLLKCRAAKFWHGILRNTSLSDQTYVSQNGNYF